MPIKVKIDEAEVSCLGDFFEDFKKSIRPNCQQLNNQEGKEKIYKRIFTWIINKDS